MATTARVLASAVCILLLVACDDDHNPVETFPTPGSAGLVSLTITGDTALERPGDTTQLTATARFSDGRSRDVTAEASWLPPLGFVVMTAPGLIRATRYGTGTIGVRYSTLVADSPIRVAPAGTFLVTGLVQAADGFFPITRATVEFSSECGTHTAATDASGLYVLPALGEATMRVEHEGFRSTERQMTVTRDARVDFELQPVDVAGTLSGEYRLVVTASRSCALPQEAMQRAYDARIFELDRELFVLLSGADMVAWAGHTGFTGTRDQSVVHFVVRDTIDDGYNFIERIASNRDLYYSGVADGTAGDAQIVAAFNGSMAIRDGTTVVASCQASDHRFELTRAER